MEGYNGLKGWPPSRNDENAPAWSANDRVTLEFRDTGGGVTHPEHLFHPFQSGAEVTGLGLYLSRAFLRSFGGELRYQPIADGACFIVDLLSALPAGWDDECAKSAS